MLDDLDRDYDPPLSSSPDYRVRSVVTPLPPPPESWPILEVSGSGAGEPPRTLTTFAGAGGEDGPEPVGWSSSLGLNSGSATFVPERGGVALLPVPVGRRDFLAEAVDRVRAEDGLPPLGRNWQSSPFPPATALPPLPPLPRLAALPPLPPPTRREILAERRRLRRPTLGIWRVLRDAWDWIRRA